MANDGPSKRTNEESFILASHGELLSPYVNRYLNDGLIQGPLDGLSNGDVVLAEHPIFYDIEHCLFSRDPELWNPVYWKACPSLKRFFFFPSDPCPTSVGSVGRVFVVLCLGCLFLRELICGTLFLGRWTLGEHLRGVSQARW